MVDEVKVSGNILIAANNASLVAEFKRDVSSKYLTVFTAISAEESINILEEESIDIIVCALQTPDFDGGAFLGEVKSRYKNVDRLVLSVVKDKIKILRLITKGNASSFIIAPWNAKSVILKISHILETRKKLLKKQLLATINKIQKLPTVPSIYNQLIEAISEDKSVRVLEKIIEKDVAIATKVLQVANSAYYGFKKTTSLVRAIMVLGFQTLRDVVLTFAITNQMSWTEAQLQILEDISVHSLIVNRCNIEFYKIKFKELIPQEFSSVGITHDIGKIILLQFFNDHFNKIIEYQNNSLTSDFYDSELKLGYEGQTHCEIGAYFLKVWNLPIANIDVALNHHSPFGVNTTHKNLLESIYFSNQFCNLIKSVSNVNDIDYSRFGSFRVPTPTLLKLATKLKSDMSQQHGI